MDFEDTTTNHIAAESASLLWCHVLFVIVFSAAIYHCLRHTWHVTALTTRAALVCASVSWRSTVPARWLLLRRRLLGRIADENRSAASRHTVLLSSLPQRYRSQVHHLPIP